MLDAILASVLNTRRLVCQCSRRDWSRPRPPPRFLFPRVEPIPYVPLRVCLLSPCPLLLTPSPLVRFSCSPSRSVSPSVARRFRVTSADRKAAEDSTGLRAGGGTASPAPAPRRGPFSATVRPTKRGHRATPACLAPPAPASAWWLGGPESSDPRGWSHPGCGKSPGTGRVASLLLRWSTLDLGPRLSSRDAMAGISVKHTPGRLPPPLCVHPLSGFDDPLETRLILAIDPWARPGFDVSAPALDEMPPWRRGVRHRKRRPGGALVGHLNARVARPERAVLGSARLDWRAGSPTAGLVETQRLFIHLILF